MKSDSRKATAKLLLQEVLLENYEIAGRETGYWGRRFKQELHRKGALKTLKRMLRPAKKDRIAAGFQKLVDAARIELTIEFTALEARFQFLFTRAELDEAEERLRGIPEYATRHPVAPEDIFPDELPDDGDEYVEGGNPEGHTATDELRKHRRNPSFLRYFPSCIERRR